MVLMGTIPTFAGGVVVEDISEDVLLNATSPGVGDIFDDTSPGDTGKCWSELTMPFCSLTGGLGRESLFAAKGVPGPFMTWRGCCGKHPIVVPVVVPLMAATVVLLLLDFLVEPCEFCFSPLDLSSAASALDTLSCFFHFVLRF